MTFYFETEGVYTNKSLSFFLSLSHETRSGPIILATKCGLREGLLCLIRLDESPGSPPEIFQLVLKSFGRSLPALPDYQSIPPSLPKMCVGAIPSFTLIKKKLFHLFYFLSQWRVGSPHHRPAADELLLEFNAGN